MLSVDDERSAAKKEIVSLTAEINSQKAANAQLGKEVAKAKAAHEKSEKARKQVEGEFKTIQSELQNSRRETLLEKEQPAAESENLIEENKGNIEGFEL